MPPPLPGALLPLLAAVPPLSCRSTTSPFAATALCMPPPLDGGVGGSNVLSESSGVGRFCGEGAGPAVAG